MLKKSKVTIEPYKNVQSLIDLIAKPDTTTLEFLADFQENKKFATLVEAQACELDLAFTCTKTGQPISEMSFDDWFSLKEIHGEKRAANILENKQLEAVSLHWLYTDDKALEELAKHDPYGYFVYAAAAMLIPVQDTRERTKQRQTSKIDGRDKFHNRVETAVRTKETGHTVAISAPTLKTFAPFWRLEKSRCWQNIQETPLAQILEANELMRKYLAAFRTAKCYHLLPFKCSDIPPSALGDTKSVANWIEEIQAAIEAVLFHEVKKRRIKHKLTYSDVVDLKIRYEGHSNFRLQSSRISPHERLMYELRDFIDEDLIENKPSLTFIMREDNLEKPVTTVAPQKETMAAGATFTFANFKPKEENDV